MQFKKHQIVQYSDLSDWEDATVIDIDGPNDEALIEFHSDKERMWAPVDFLRQRT